MKLTFGSSNANVQWRKERLERALTRIHSFSKQKDKCQCPLTEIWILLSDQETTAVGALLNNHLAPMSELKDYIWDAQFVHLFTESLVCSWKCFRYCSSPSSCLLWFFCLYSLGNLTARFKDTFPFHLIPSNLILTQPSPTVNCSEATFIQ